MKNSNNFKKRLLNFLCVSIAIFYVSSFSFADVLYLKDGKKLEGRILKEKDDEVVLEIEISKRYVPLTFNIEEIRKVIKTDLSEADRNKDIEELSQIALDFFRQGEFDKAIPYLKLIIFKNPDDAYLYNVLGVCYLNLKMSEEGINNLRKAMSLYSKLDKPPYHAMANICITMQNIEQAIEYLRMASAQEPNNSRNYRLLGEIYSGKREYDLAYYYLKKALAYAKDPNTIKTINEWLEKPELAKYKEETK